jgi:RNA polymerase sigma-70 factor (ECF subfamily)
MEVNVTDVDLRPTTDFGEVFRSHADRLWRALLAYARDPEIASDALAEAFAQGIR